MGETATARAKQMRYLLEVTLEIGFLTTSPLAISLYDKGHISGSFIKMALKEYGLPIENEHVMQRIQR